MRTRQDQPDFFIIGNQKSGTTWLMELMNYHPEFVCWNELMIMTLVRDGVARLFNNVNGTVKEGHMSTFQEFHYPDPEFTHADIDDVLAVIWKNLIRDCPKDAKFYGEKSPDYITVLDDLVRYYPKAKFIHLVRDPRDVAVSFLHHFRREEHFYEKGMAAGLSPDLKRFSVKNRATEGILLDAITNWKSNHSLIETMKTRFPEKFFTIRYEDFDAKHLNEMFEWLGGRTSEELCQRLLEATDVNSRPKSEYSFFTFGKSGNWHDLDDNIKKYMHSVLGAWLETYKYN